jgi:hypothetical protein
MSDDDSAKLLTFLRNGITPTQQLLNLLQAQAQVQQNQQQAVYNSLQYLNPLQLLQNLSNPSAFAQSPQHVAQTVQNGPQQDSKTSKQEKLKSTQFSPSMAALKLNLDHSHMQNTTHAHSDQPPLSSISSIDEGILTSSNSPTETASGATSPHEDEHELPKESEHTSLKRPAAIQDMLMKKKKKARLDGLMDGLINKKVSTFYIHA